MTEGGDTAKGVTTPYIHELRAELDFLKAEKNKGNRGVGTKNRQS